MYKLIAFVLLITFVTGQNTPFNGNPNWCTPLPTSIGPDYPTLPNQFQTVVEANYRNSQGNFTIEFEEFYDFRGNRGTLIAYTSTYDIRQYFLYDTNEMITIFSEVCLVSQLNTSAMGTPFGWESVNNTGHIFSPINALQLEYTHQFLGDDTIRGISVQRWNSCAYLEDSKSTVKITWSFSNNATWTSVIAGSSVPVEMLVEGLTDDGVEWVQHYEYVKFRPKLIEDKEIFETPVGIYCPGRKPTKPLPKIPPHFSFRIEATSVDLNISTNQAEWYDDESKLVRIDHQPILAEEIAMWGNTSITEIHDFRRGIRFVIDRKGEKCLNYSILDPQSIDSDYATNRSFVRLRTALELFSFDKNASAQYEYHGTKKIRNIDCDVWIAIRENWPPLPYVNRTSTWEWYFMSNNWVSLNYGIEEYNIPVKLIITNYNLINGTFLSTTIVYNYFDYNQEKPEIFAYDLQSCFSDQSFKFLTFKLNVPYTQVVTNKRDFRYAILIAITRPAYLLPTRIADLQIEEKGNETLVIFKLLDKLPITGDVENPVEEISLSDAYDVIEKVINRGNLSFIYNGTAFAAVAKSLKEVGGTGDSSNGNKGSDTVYIILGSGVCGIIIGVIAVILTNFIIRRKKGDETVLKMSGLMNPNFKD